MQKEIFTITTINLTEGVVLLDDIDFKEYRDRCVGYYFDLETAKKCVSEDWGALNEAGYYSHLVIERLPEGLYPGCRYEEKQTEWWYYRDYEKNEWISCLKPKSVLGVISFGMG